MSYCLPWGGKKERITLMPSRKSLLRYAGKMKDTRQELLADVGAFEKLASQMVEQNIKRVYIIVGQQSRKLKLCDSFVQILQNAGVRCFLSTHKKIEPDRFSIEACASECQTYNCEAVVAFGGGKAIDVGKMVSVWRTNPWLSLYQMRGAGKIPNPGLPLYVAATTGSGAESSACALIRQGKQISLYYSEYLIPRTVVLDPDLVLRLPMESMAKASILALTHAVEAYVSPRASAFPADKANATIAVPIFFSYLEQCYKHGIGNEMYLQLMMAPYYSGVAARRIGFGYTHSLSLYLSDKYDIAPGSVCAVLLPIILEYEFDRIIDPLVELAALSHLCSSRATKEEAARAFIDGFKSLCRRVDLPAELSFLRMDDFGDIIRKAFNDAYQWSCPKKMTVKQAQAILKKLRY